MARREFPDTPDGDEARAAYAWKAATRKNYKAPPKKLKPEDQMPRGQHVSTKDQDAPPSDQTPAEMRAQARAAFLEQLTGKG